MDNKRLKKFFLNECSPTERKEIVEWLLAPENDFVVRSWMKENWDNINNSDIKSTLDNSEIQELWMSIQEEISAGTINDTNSDSQIQVTNKTIYFGHRLLKYTVAAAVFLLMVGGYLFYQINKPLKNNIAVVLSKSKYKNDVKAPESNKSTILLAGGTKIFLNNISEGLVATQNKMSVIKDKSGQISYIGNEINSLIYNTLSVPYGSKLQKVLLSDGTNVWLNAGSSITFPISFIGNERRLSINGEAYFEVSKNKMKPFFVTHNDVTVKVLGTHFNVNAYANESVVKVTLLEGSVHVFKGKEKQILIPGQQVAIKAEKFDLSNDVDLKKVTAWKNEQFYFNGDDIVTIMKEVEKVYNVKVIYKDNIDFSFVAKISRHENLSELLQVLELTDVVHFKIEGNNVIVSK